MRVLVVEDEAALRDSLQERLAAAGFSVDVARDGNEGLFAGLEYPLDVAVIDLGLPNLPGLEVIRRLRAARKTYPILILTARDRKSTRLNSSHLVISYAAFCLKKKKLTKMQLDNQKEIAEMQNETQKEIAGIQSATSRQNTKDQAYAQNEMLPYQQKQSTARVASIMENTNLSKQQQVSEIMRQMLFFF